jgi:hypothetical protein
MTPGLGPRIRKVAPQDNGPLYRSLGRTLDLIDHMPGMSVSIACRGLPFFSPSESIMMVKCIASMASFPESSGGTMF